MTLTALLAYLILPIFMWPAILISFTLIAWTLEESGFYSWCSSAIGTMLLTAIVVSQLGLTFDTVLHSLSYIGIGVVAYIAAGIAWGIGKWYFKISEVRDKFVELREEYAQYHGLPIDFHKELEDKNDALVPAEWAVKYETAYNFVAKIINNCRIYTSASTAEMALNPRTLTSAIMPVATRHKASICKWIAFWPVSFIWTMINDPVRKAVNYIFNQIKAVFGTMSTRMFADLHKI